MGAAGWARDGSPQDFIRFWGDFGTCVFQFFDVKKLNISCFFGLVSRSFCYRFLNRHFDAWDFPVEVFAGKVLQKQIFHGNRF